MHYDNALANQVRVVVCNAGEVECGSVQRVGVAVCFLLGAVQNNCVISFLACENQIKVLGTDGLVVGNVGCRLEVRDVSGVNNALHLQRVEHDLSSVLTRQSAVYVRGYVLEQVVQVAVLHGVSSPSGASQTSLARSVASNNQQHLGSLETGNGVVRSELGCRLTSDDFAVLQVLDVASRPSAVHVGERGRQIGVSGRVIVAAVENGENHLRHLRTGDGRIGLERTVGITFDYAQTRQCVNRFSRLDVSLIGERCTSKHGERASERQYQCENLFEILHGVFSSLNFFELSLLWCL